MLVLFQWLKQCQGQHLSYSLDLFPYIHSRMLKFLQLFLLSNRKKEKLCSNGSEEIENKLASAKVRRGIIRREKALWASNPSTEASEEYHTCFIH